MHTTIGYLLSKPEDFKKCKFCWKENWRENKECVNCGGIFFEEITEEDIKDWLQAIEEAKQKGYHMCEECEMEV